MNEQKISKAIEIFKSELQGAKGKFRAYASETNGSEVEIFNEDGYYCTINVRSGKIKGI